MVKIPEALLPELSELVALRLGLHFPQERWPDLERCIQGALEEAGHRDVESGFRSLLSPSWTAGQTQILADHLTVGETYFFREIRALEVLEEHVLPFLARRDHQGGSREIRVWSAGCATGEEPYSVAILLSSLVAHWMEGRAKVLATDLNRRSLQRASAGVYGEWSFRGAPPWLRQKYFVGSADGQWILVPAVRKMVTFAYLNLAEDVYPSFLNHTQDMDIILCRNVLMYFAPETRQRVVRNLFRTLAPGGWLIVSPAETSQILFSDFVTVGFDGATFYRKATEGNAGIQAHRVELRDPTAASPPPVVSADLPKEGNTWAEQPDVAPPSEAGTQVTEPGPIYESALAHLAAGHYEEAAQAGSLLLSSDPSDGAAMLLLARVYANQGRLAEALTWCEKSLVANKTHACAHYLRATILQEKGSFEDARASLKLAVYLNPQFLLAHFALGNLTRAQGNSRASGKHFANALLLLERHRQEDIVPESDGITAGRLKEIIALQTGKAKTTGAPFCRHEDYR